MKIGKQLCVLMLVATAAGCAVHKDSLTTFRVEGTPTLDGSTRASGAEVLVELIDIGMDDAKAKRGKAFASFKAPVGQAFSVTNSYFWGTSASSSKDAIVAVRVSSSGCQDVQRQYRLGELHRQGRELMVGLGSIILKCS